MASNIEWQLESIAGELMLIRKLLAQFVELKYELAGYTERGDRFEK